jgi:hypothetical protein
LAPTDTRLLGDAAKPLAAVADHRGSGRDAGAQGRSDEAFCHDPESRRDARLSPPSCGRGTASAHVALPRETVALIDELKERHGLRNRSQVLIQLIEQGRDSAQQQTT